MTSSSYLHTPDDDGTKFGAVIRAEVVRIIDGDTIVVRPSWDVIVRLKDCWAAERSTEDGLKATMLLRALLPEGTHVAVEIDSSDASSAANLMTFGRVIANIRRIGDKQTISERMVGMGRATKEKNG